MAALDPSEDGWRKSRRSGTNGNCVEVNLTEDSVKVRDTKDGGRGPILTFTASEWTAFAAGVRDGEFDL